MDHEYQKWRCEIEKRFENANASGEQEVTVSPSGNFQLSVEKYSTGPSTWSYSRGQVVELSTGKELADVKRNYGQFWRAWFEHANGNEYLLCGEDYQGQTVLNLTTGQTVHHFSKHGYNGGAFCWIAAWASPDSSVLAVEGCYWGAEGEVAFFDFTAPDQLPYKELHRVDGWPIGDGWVDDSFGVTAEVEFRKADGVAYEELSDEEQQVLDRDRNLCEYRKVEGVVSCKELQKHSVY